MTEERTLEIIAAFGADAARWPDDERAAALALAGRPAVAAALAEARALDALLGEWARADVVAAPFDAARLTAPAKPAAPAPSTRRRWFATGAIAAAVAVVALAPMRSMAPETPQQLATIPPPSSVPSATASSEDGSDAGFAYVFTPTVDEDALI